MQWGKIYLPNASTATVTLPKPFTTACYSLTLGVIGISNVYPDDNAGFARSCTTTSITVANGTGQGSFYSYWFAVGS
jgi:hypothetical protein